MKKAAVAIGLLLGAILALALYALLAARRAPVVRTASIAMADWPAGATPVKLALITDLHVGSLAIGMPRLADDLDRVTALHPDLILIAGDFTDGYDRRTLRRSAPGLTATLGRLHAPLGVFAVAGNHDHFTDMRTLWTILSDAHVTLLPNTAIEAGPLAIGGLDDPSTGFGRMNAVAGEVRALPGAKLILTHYVRDVSAFPRDVGLLLAGHTHCGQVSPPLIGPISRWFGDRRHFRCGVSQEDGRTIVVSAGFGTTGLPMRLNAPPDLWLLTLGPR